MAFNDMNSWDEDPDELLRRRWQQTFADFEVQPRPVVSRRLLGWLSAERRRKAMHWLVAIGLLLFLSAGLVYRDQVAQRVASGHGLTLVTKSLRTAPPLSSRRSHPIRERAERRLPLPSTVVGPLSNRTVSKEQPGGQPLPVYGDETMEKGLSLRPRAPAKGAIMDKPGVPAQPKVVSSISGRSLTTNQPSTNQLSEPPLDGWLQLNSRGLHLASQLRALPDQLPIRMAEDESPVQVSVAHPRWRWFVDALPLSSFQWMSVPATSASAYLSNVNAPAAFSPATWGYQLNGGVRFRHWLAYVATGQLRRWAYYTVNENQYQLVPTATDPHQLVRQVHTVAENRSLPLLGAGLSQQSLLAQGRYAVELGGQVSYLPTSGQPLIGLRGGATRRLLLNWRTELQIGLTAEYGLNHLVNDQRQLLIHPLVVGFGLRLQPR